KKASVNEKCMIDNIEDLLSLVATIQEFLDHRKTGNENFKLGKYTEVIENYTAALSSNIKSRPFATAAWLWPLMEIRQRKLLGESPYMRWLETMNKHLVISGDLFLFLNLNPMKS
ncbi:hypothetical protein RYX36_019118, partial [Vicia faba]